MKRVKWLCGLFSLLLCTVVVFIGCSSREVQTIQIIDEETLTEREMFYVLVAKDMYIGKIEISDPPKEQEISAFFRWIIAQELYVQKSEEWFDGSMYRIPIEDIQTVINKHLNAEQFSLEGIFPVWDENSTQGYDTENQEFITQMIGGYGGAQSMCLLVYNEKQDNVEVVVGVYDMNKLFSDEPSEQIVKTYTVYFSSSSDKKSDFKILYAKEEVLQ